MTLDETWSLMVGEGDLPVSLADLFSRPAWHADAACREHPEVKFVLDRGDDPRPAKAVCAGCLVRDECLAFALASPDIVGVWAGTSSKEHVKLRTTQPTPRRAA